MRSFLKKTLRMSEHRVRKSLLFLMRSFREKLSLMRSFTCQKQNLFYAKLQKQKHFRDEILHPRKRFLVVAGCFALLAQTPQDNQHRAQPEHQKDTRTTTSVLHRSHKHPRTTIHRAQAWHQQDTRATTTEHNPGTIKTPGQPQPSAPCTTNEHQPKVGNP